MVSNFRSVFSPPILRLGAAIPAVCSAVADLCFTGAARRPGPAGQGRVGPEPTRAEQSRAEVVPTAESAGSGYSSLPLAPLQAGPIPMPAPLQAGPIPMPRRPALPACLSACLPSWLAGASHGGPDLPEAGRGDAQVQQRVDHQWHQSPVAPVVGTSHHRNRPRDEGSTGEV